MSSSVILVLLILFAVAFGLDVVLVNGCVACGRPGGRLVSSDGWKGKAFACNWCPGLPLGIFDDHMF